MPYEEENYILLSGIQHFAFCRRQWALIHIEQQWHDNLLTVEGNIIHDKAHNHHCSEKRNGVLIVRGMAVASSELGLSGTCDVVEFHSDERGVAIAGHKGKYVPVPIEYKRGKPKKGKADELQLCAQAICIEEMLGCDIAKGYLFYGETKHRMEVLFVSELRMCVLSMAREMHTLYIRRHTPTVKTGAFCRACSLMELCLPKLCKGKSSSSYIHNMLENDS